MEKATQSDFARNKESRKLEAARESYYEAMEGWSRAVNQKLDRMIADKSSMMSQ